MENAFEKMRGAWARLLETDDKSVAEAAESCGLSEETVRHLRRSRAYAEARVRPVRGFGGGGELRRRSEGR